MSNQPTHQPNGEDCARCSRLNLPYPFICQRPPTRTTPDTPASNGDAADGLAQSGVLTPGCDCGHDGRGLRWHARDCAWLVDTEFALPANPGLFRDPTTPRRVVPPDAGVTARRTLTDLREQYAAAIREVCGEGLWEVIVQRSTDAIMAIHDDDMDAIRAAAAQVQVRDRQLAAVRALLADPDNRWAIEPGDLRAALDAGEATP